MDRRVDQEPYELHVELPVEPHCDYHTVARAEISVQVNVNSSNIVIRALVCAVRTARGSLRSSMR